MNRRPWLALLALLLAACVTTEPATPTPTVVAPTPTLAPTATPTPSPTPTASPTASPSPSPSPTPTATPAAVSAELAARLQRALDELRAENSVPGMQAAVIMPDGSRWAGASGVGSVAAGTTVTVDMPFVAGSITKTFVMATIMQLADEGRLSIDDPLSRWLPTFPRATDITLRELLSHTGGVFNYFEHPLYNRLVFGDPTHVWTPQEILDTFAGPPDCDPGTCYHYSNTGFVLLGLVIEKVTGHTLGEELRNRWIGPLALSDTFFQYDTPLPADASEGHLIRRDDRLIELGDGSDYRPTHSAASVAWAAGAIASTATDLATWCRDLYGGQLLSAAALAEMTDFAANPYSDEAYGLGTRTRFLDGRRMVGHTGSLRGFYAAMWHFELENVTVVVMLNLGRIDPNPLADRLARIALAAAGYPPPTPSPSPSPSPTATRPSPTPSPTVPPSASPTPSATASP